MGATAGFFTVIDVDWSAQCAAVVPCLNEAVTVGPLVREIRAYLPRVIVMDDGSTDDTADLATSAGAEVIRHPHARGKGAALRSGWQRARELGCAWALCLDGDGQHAPADVPKFFACAESTGASLVIGNRMQESARMPVVRRVVNRWMSAKLSALAGRKFPDSQCGFRLIRLDALDRVPLRTNGFEIESEQVLAFAAAGERIEFVPIRVLYRGEQSKIRAVRDTIRWFRWLRDWRRGAAMQNP